MGRGLVSEVYRGNWHGEVAIKRFFLPNPTAEQLSRFKEEVRGRAERGEECREGEGEEGEGKWEGGCRGEGEGEGEGGGGRREVGGWRGES